MLYIIQLFLFSLVIFIVRAFNESCAADKTSCVPPLNCTSAYCLCSPLGKTTDENNPLLFWTGDDCVKCPLGYTSSGSKCYLLIWGAGKQMNWIRAQKRCQEDGGDLLVIRNEKEYKYMAGVLQCFIKDDELLQRSPLNGTKFASVWIGAHLQDWNSGTFELVSFGPALTKNSYFWCSSESPLGVEPNHLRLKETGEHQECIGLAIFPNRMVCMHDWFCSWDSYVLCEIHPPLPPTPEMLPLEEPPEESDNTRLYIGIGVGVVVVLLVSIGIGCCICRSKKDTHRTRSTESDESAISES